MELNKKAAYLQGLVDGLGIDDTTKEGKIIKAMSALLGEMAEAIESVDEDLSRAYDQINDLSDELEDLEADLYEEEDEDGESEDAEDEDSDGDDDAKDDDIASEPFYEVACPNCGETVYVSEDDLEGRVCYGGLDLSSTTDITAFVLVFPPEDENDKYIILPYFWIPEDNLDLRVRRDHVPYDVWERQGFLQTTEGNVVHYGYIEKFIESLGERFNIREIAFDRWGAVQMVQNLEGMGFTVVPFGQGFKDMSPPTKELMKLVLEQRIAHGGHPVLRWMMDNIFIRTDPAGNIKPDKEKSTEKIDGAVATIMALDRAIRCGNDKTESVYDSRGLLFI